MNHQDNTPAQLTETKHLQLPPSITLCFIGICMFDYPLAT